MEKLYTVSKKTRPGADCGSDHELLIAKFRLKLKKLGKTSKAYIIINTNVQCALCLLTLNLHKTLT